MDDNFPYEKELVFFGIIVLMIVILAISVVSCQETYEPTQKSLHTLQPD